ncbi:MAG: AAA family ATPase [Chloroflexi bacterium]|nr:AAA family ATPase [Chloroflexota bacterium]
MSEQPGGAGIRMHLLGRFEVRSGPQVLIDASWPRRMAKALLKLVALQKDRRLGREQILDALWPDLAPAAAGHNLRRNLGYLREALSRGGLTCSLLTVTRDAVTLCADLILDVDEFRSRAQAARAVATDPRLYEGALAVYGGELLPEDLYEEWAAGPREQVRTLRNELLMELGQLHRARGELDLAAERLNELVEADPLCEEAHRALMLLYAHMGRRERALRQYQRCREAFQRELGVEPSAETEALYRRIAERRLGPAINEAAQGQMLAGPSEFASRRRTPCVGREEELAAHNAVLDEALAGRGSLVMLTGEPGVGKTRLAEEVAAQARSRGFFVAAGHCQEMGETAPYTPFVGAIEYVARVMPPENLRRALGDVGAEAARLAPELRRLFPDLPPPVEMPPEEGRRYLFNALVDFLERAARAQPMLLILEDLHWADESSLLLLQHIARRLAEMPVVVLGTYRDVEMAPGGALARTLQEMLRRRLARETVLGRLPEPAVAQMLKAHGRGDPPPSLVSLIYDETEGNPFFVEELVRHLLEQGKLLDPEGRWLSEYPVGEIEVPRSVRLVIERRLERVGKECRRILTGAAVIGRAFSFELLEALGDHSTGSGQALDADALLDAVDEAERARLIMAVAGGSQAHFTFAHELIRQTLVSGLSLPRRQRLHLRVAEATERVYAGCLDARAADLAYHLYQAGAVADPHKTAHYLTVAGDQAIEAAAFEDALRLYESALPSLSGDDRRGRAGMLYKRGLARRSLGRWEEALADWREALDTYEELGDAEAVGRISADIAVQLAWAFRIEEALDVTRRGLIALGERVSPDRCRLLAYGGLGLSMGGYYTAGEDMTVQALTLAEQLGDTRLLGAALTAKGAHHWFYMHYPQSVEALLRGAALLRSRNDLWALADALVFLQNGLGFLGRFDEVVKIGEELESLAERLGHLGALIMAGRNRLVFGLTLLEPLTRYEEFCKSHREVCQRAGGSWAGPDPLFGLLHFWRGQWPQAAGSFEEAGQVEPPGASAGWHCAFLFLYRAYAGDRNSALTVLRRLRTAYFPRAGQPNGWAPWTALLAAVEGLALLGERDEASALYPLVLEGVKTGCLIRAFDARLLQTVAGIAAAAGSQWDKAEEHYETALRQARELRIVMEEPEARRWYSRMLIDRDGPGDREKALRLLTEAIAMYWQIGMPKHVEMAEAILSEA